MSTVKKGSIGSAMLWMFVISILLFWLPVLGGLIAGFVGGRTVIDNAHRRFSIPLATISCEYT